MDRIAHFEKYVRPLLSCKTTRPRTYKHDAGVCDGAYLCPQYYKDPFFTSTRDGIDPQYALTMNNLDLEQLEWWKQKGFPTIYFFTLQWKDLLEGWGERVEPMHRVWMATDAELREALKKADEIAYLENRFKGRDSRKTIDVRQFRELADLSVGSKEVVGLVK